MAETLDRPDPDRLLRQLQAEEARARRGKLKIFLGFAPGVGKTYRMLQVARDLVVEQSLDLVVGIVETHQRHETAALVLGLELLPCRAVDYRGHALEEFDLDGALARKPRLLLVDELAHTNAPGSRHPKRWQDVEELLDAGIDVFSTMNVQHLESLNDVIAQITHVQVRETVPDRVFDRADAVELVDIAPEELLQRLREGKVYLSDQARSAADHFFRTGNLLALRELALRRTAQHVDEDVQAYREAHGVSTTWPTGERILVAVGPAPSSRRLLRAAARMAAGLRCPWIAAYVTPPGGMGEAALAALESHLRVAESLGATVAPLVGARVSTTLLDYARKQNITRLIIGKPTHSRLRDRLRGSLLDEVVRGSGEIDLQVIRGDSPEDEPLPSGGGPALRSPGRFYAAALGLVGVALAVALGLRAVLVLPDLEMIFLLAVLVAAVRLGRGPALLTAALGVACYDFFFVPPFQTFSVADRRYFLTFVMMFGVGIIASEMTGRLRRQEREAHAREERTSGLYALTRELASTDRREAIASIAARHASALFSSQASFLLARPDGALPAGDPKEWSVAQWAHEHGEAAGIGTDTLPGAPLLCAPLKVGTARLGVMVLRPPWGDGWRMGQSAEQRALLDVFCRQVAVALERARLEEETRASTLRVRTEEMRSSLLSTVSHDLRTPLGSITGAATTLRESQALPAATQRELIDSIVEEAARLERLVANLLDMTRLDAGGAVLKREWVPVEELIGSALTRLEKRFEARPVRIDIAEEVPLLQVDPVLFEQLLVNLLENVDKYTPAGTPVALEVTREGDEVLLSVIDRGPGLPPGSEDRVFERFFRGDRTGKAGAGLGLAIGKAIVEAHGGSISARNRREGGAEFRVRLPIEGSGPEMEKA